MRSQNSLILVLNNLLDDSICCRGWLGVSIVDCAFHLVKLLLRPSSTSTWCSSRLHWASELSILVGQAQNHWVLRSGGAHVDLAQLYSNSNETFNSFQVKWVHSNIKIALAFLNLNQLKVNTKSFTLQQCLLWYQVSRNKFLFSFFIRLLCMEIKLGLSIDKFCQHYLEYSKRASQAFKHWPTVQLAILIS